jgi:ubiquinone/menaquinone biosynthesis C-methylase UbiE
MEALEVIRDQQRESWNKFSPGWKKWDKLFMDFLDPMGNEIIRLISPKENDMVLDVASGTGEPGLTIASTLRGGVVVITDLAEKMLAVARENAEARGIRNIETLACDVSDLPFSANTFDAVSCRLGFMFFPDMQLAANEMTRVLKPGGRIATSVWNVPEKNFWITVMMSTINETMNIPAIAPGSPGMFRCAKEGLIAGMFEKAGLKNVSVREVTGKLRCKTADVYWNVMTELAAPVVAALSEANEKTRDEIRQKVFEKLNQRYPNGEVDIESSALIIYGEKRKGS